MSNYHVPSQKELTDAIRAECAFLVQSHGFQEVTRRTEKYVNPYSVLYRKNRVSILVEGISYGFNLSCQLVIDMDAGRRKAEHIHLAYLMMLRAPHLLEPTYPDERGQLTQLHKVGEGLRAAAMDIVAGDLSKVDEIKEFIRTEQAKTEQKIHTCEMMRIDSMSQEAFHNGDYQEVINLLLGVESELAAAGRLRLELARKRLTQ